jgi:DNA-binding transcriptional regulator YhcF (GntR family)
VKISINKESNVPIRDQLIEQIAVQIASGILKNKEKLPSIRALADRLGIHYSTVTAAYNHLADAGLLEIRQGSGVRVAGKESSLDTQGRQPLETLLNEFTAKVAEQGYSKADLNAAFKKLEKRSPVKRILAVDTNPDFHPILLAELKPHFDIEVQTCTVEELKKQNYEDALIVSSLYHVSAFQDNITDLTRLVVCNIEPGGAEIGAATALPSGKLVLLVSVSHTMFKIASKLIASVRGEEIPIRSVMPSDTTELNYMMKHADLILCDSSSQSAVLPIAGKVKVLKFQLYSYYTIDLIKDRVAKWG